MARAVAAREGVISTAQPVSPLRQPRDRGLRGTTSLGFDFEEANKSTKSSVFNFVPLYLDVHA